MPQYNEKRLTPVEKLEAHLDFMRNDCPEHLLETERLVFLGLARMAETVGAISIDRMDDYTDIAYSIVEMRTGIGSCDRCGGECEHTHDNEVTFSNLPDYGSHMTLQRFRECVECGGFIDDDGSGNLATETSISNVDVNPSDLANMNIPEWATHVVWFNK